jgi:hypothetical protein
MSNPSYAATLTGKEEYLKSIGSKGTPDVAKEFERINYVYTFPNKPQAKCLQDAIDYVWGKEALKKAIEEECSAFEVKVSREKDTLAKEHNVNRAIGVVDDFRSQDKDYVFWQVLRSELAKLKE